MGSTLTTVLAARLPNDEAATVRDLANQYGVTVTQTIRVLLNHSLADLVGEPAKADSDSDRDRTALRADAGQRVTELKAVVRRQELRAVPTC
jgi:hypothetical protein